MTPRAASKTDNGVAVRVAATASFGAALIHLTAMPSHWQEWPASGMFFGLIALFQLAWGLAVLVSPSASVLVLGVLANLGSIALWGVARTVGVPFGPHAGQPEMVGAADLCALMLQCYIVLGAAWVWSRSYRTEAVPGFGYAMVLTGAGSVIAVATAVGMVSGLQDDHHAPAGTAEHGHHQPHGTAEHGHHSPDDGPADAPADEHADEHHDVAPPASPEPEAEDHGGAQLVRVPAPVHPPEHGDDHPHG
ncbi:hypothetical protein [Mycolicibacterium palauense]|uniref:hypothetical protein n=1 Tax=Mycolicibacterium palauense TaxID=2034511 RepID=UPI0011459D24|nr:hypothetical protein [Mycolicibacterium palauense]